MKEYIIKVADDKMDIMGGMLLMEPAKELVRCRDCKYWFDHAEQCDNPYSGAYIEGCVTADWYCADGKKRDIDGK